MHDDLTAMSSAERKEMWHKVGGRLLGGTIGIIGCIVGFLVMVIVGGFIISLFTGGLTLGWEIVFGS